MSDSDKMLSLARLAADDRTPEHERAAAAMALAKMVVSKGSPTSDRPDMTRRIEVLRAELISVETNYRDACKTIDALRVRVSELSDKGNLRTVAALEEIVRHNTAELEQLRADKQDLEDKNKKLRRKNKEVTDVNKLLVERPPTKIEVIRVPACHLCGNENTILGGCMGAKCARLDSAGDIKLMFENAKIKAVSVDSRTAGMFGATPVQSWEPIRFSVSIETRDESLPQELQRRIAQ